ncbi:glucosidase II beta subunit-like protein-domain-containing protein [Annulohypoxylon truncatum]|uniref:glucosidase II beta subunit-like protein-domain-containing protein n=1 Tax=Annulohypoxylon truncatum TaxID=327061 RepID=UPI00200886C9|nr:glucosidase II beta subunit-like protein-domain-containing protein [Annulohypoxylon truncatum]KAI1204482.1 glucosidase II beta subunit-like protein-domain-containing protein [Annulohypoxylon truncatum]
MRRYGAFLFLSTLLPSGQARQPEFSIHHDLLAYPQFEVTFSESYISENEAQALVKRSNPSHPDYHADFPGQTDLASNVRAAKANGDDKIDESYEIMTMPPNRYLCAIPIIEPPPAPNKTAADPAKAEEARELARASAHGWDLISGLEGECLYHMSGWWSYSFCYGRDVKQFHALPASVKSGPPVRDINIAEYVLGRVVPDHHSTSRSSRRGQSNPHNPNDKGDSVPTPPPNTELQIKGDQRYLVQKMGDGTICDLTGRERTIEIQYHCSPGSTKDRIGWIKEVTTCAYLMVVNTPRLCVDVAFLPPKEERANVISCRAIVPETDQASWHARKTLEAEAAMIEHMRGEIKGPITIGGVIVGGRRLLGDGEDGQEGHKLAPPRNFRNPNIAPLVEVVAKGTSREDGGKVDMLTDEELTKLNLSPEMVEELKKELQKLAGDRGWKLEVVEMPGDPREIRGVVDTDEDEVEDEVEAKNGNEGGEKKPDGGDKGEDTGSEEKFFKEEL